MTNDRWFPGRYASLTFHTMMAGWGYGKISPLATLCIGGHFEISIPEIYKACSACRWQKSPDFNGSFQVNWEFKVRIIFYID